MSTKKAVAPAAPAAAAPEVAATVIVAAPEAAVEPVPAFETQPPAPLPEPEPQPEPEPEPEPLPEPEVEAEKFYMTPHFGLMIDTESLVHFSGAPTPAPTTGWLTLQMNAGKIVECDADGVAV